MVRYLCVLAFLAVLQARAATITFETLPGVVEHDTYNGFVGASVDGVFYNLICNDYDHTTDAPSGPWEFNISMLPTLTFARFGNDDAARVIYRRAALLLAGDGNTVAGLVNATDPHDITAYQYAFWKLFGAAVDDVNNASALLQATLDDLSNGIDYSSIYAALRVYTPAAAAIENQEFLGLVTQSITDEVPEPRSGLLLAAGLLWLFFRKRLWRALSPEQ